MTLNEGDQADVETVVTGAMTASAVADREGERYPAVLGTPSLLTELERVAALLLQPHLGADEVSVGVGVEIRHLAPTPIGEILSSHARFTGREGKLFWFEVWAEDAMGLVGKGRHSRAIVDLKAIETRAAERRSRT